MVALSMTDLASNAILTTLKQTTSVARSSSLTLVHLSTTFLFWIHKLGNFRNGNTVLVNTIDLLSVWDCRGSYVACTITGHSFVLAA